MTRYVVRLTHANGDVEYVTTPRRTAVHRKFRTPDVALATRYRREEAYTVQTHCATMNPNSTVEFVEEPK